MKDKYVRTAIRLRRGGKTYSRRFLYWGPLDNEAKPRRKKMFAFIGSWAAGIADWYRRTETRVFESDGWYGAGMFGIGLVIGLVIATAIADAC